MGGNTSWSPGPTQCTNTKRPSTTSLSPARTPIKRYNTKSSPFWGGGVGEWLFREANPFWVSVASYIWVKLFREAPSVTSTWKEVFLRTLEDEKPQECTSINVACVEDLAWLRLQLGPHLGLPQHPRSSQTMVYPRSSAGFLTPLWHALVKIMSCKKI